MFFYAFLAATEGRHKEIQDDINEKFWPTLHANWKVWPAVHLVNFAFVPPPLRILYINVIALFWRTFLSVFGNRRKVTVSEAVIPELTPTDACQIDNMVLTSDLFETEKVRAD